MECRDTKLLMEPYWDRHLPPEMADRVQSHLRTCAACRAEYGAVTELLAEPEPVIVSTGLRDRILAAVAEAEIASDSRPAAASSYRWWMEVMQSPWMGAAAACLVFFFMGWFSHRLWTASSLETTSRLDQRAMPDPLIVASWTQSLALPGPVGPLPAIAQSVALDRMMRPEVPTLTVRNRVLENAVRPEGSPPAIPQIPVIVAGLSTLGA